MVLKPITLSGYRLFGRYVHRYRDRLSGLAETLKKARLPYTAEEYVAGVILLTIIAFFVSLFTALFMLSGYYRYDWVVSTVFSLILAVSIAGITFILLLQYPYYVLGERKENIEGHITYAVTHMATLAGTGIQIVDVFRALTHFKDYGEISRECAFIVRDVEVFGKDVFTAIADAAHNSPSSAWAEVLWGMVSTLRSGGNLRRYLSEKARALVTMHEQMEKRAMETLNVITEIYMVIFVLVPLIAVIMAVFMAMLGGSIYGLDPRILLYLAVYFLTPLFGIFFLILAETSKPREVF